MIQIYKSWKSFSQIQHIPNSLKSIDHSLRDFGELLKLFIENLSEEKGNDVLYFYLLPHIYETLLKVLC